MTDALKSDWTPYLSLMPFETALALSTEPCQLLGETPAALIPSVVLGDDGTYAQSVHIATSNYLIEARGGVNPEYDIIRLRSVFNYRVGRGSAQVTRIDRDPLVLPTATVTLLHGYSFEFTTSLQYTGTHRDHWLGLVFRAIPPTLLGRFEE